MFVILLCHFFIISILYYRIILGMRDIMLNINLLEQLIIVSIPCGIIAMAFIQKTKMMFRSSKIIILYSFIINMIFGIVFTMSFGSQDIIESLWIGLFSFIEADSLYRTLEGKLLPFSELKGNEIKYDL